MFQADAINRFNIPNVEPVNGNVDDEDFNKLVDAINRMLLAWRALPRACNANL